MMRSLENGNISPPLSQVLTVSDSVVTGVNGAAPGLYVVSVDKFEVVMVLK